MNVLVLTQFFPPEACAAGNRTYAVCAALRDAGHEVRVLTGFPNFPDGRIPPPYRGGARAAESIDGIAVRRVWTYASPKLRAKDRMLNWLSVAAGACLAGAFEGRGTDAIFVTCPPITLALPALLLRSVLRARLIVDVRDSYPDVAIKMGVWSERSPVARIVARAASALYRRADAVSCVTGTVREQVLRRGADPARTFVARNGFDPVAPASKAPYEHREGEFVAAFAGNIGVATGADIIVQAARLLREVPRIRFVLAGAGSDFERLRGLTREYGLKNLELLGAVDRATALAVLRDADICLVPLRRGIRDSLPTKIFDALYVGCPVVVSGEGEASEFVDQAGGGWSVEPEDAAALAEVIRRCAGNPADCREAGERGRRYVTARCSRSAAVRDIVSATERSCAIVAKTSQAYL